MKFIYFILLYFFFFQNFLCAILRPSYFSSFIPNFWPALIVIISIKFPFLQGFIFTIIGGYFISTSSILPSPTFVFASFFCFMSFKLIYELSSWKDLAILTILGAAASCVFDLTLLLSTEMTNYFLQDLKSIFIGLPLRALLNGLMTLLLFKIFIINDLRKDITNENY